MNDPASEQVWESGWGGHERAQRLRLARLTLDQKLDWLEEAQQIAGRLSAARGTNTDDGPDAARRAGRQ